MSLGTDHVQTPEVPNELSFGARIFNKIQNVSDDAAGESRNRFRQFARAFNFPLQNRADQGGPCVVMNLKNLFGEELSHAPLIL